MELLLLRSGVNCGGTLRVCDAVTHGHWKKRLYCTTVPNGDGDCALNRDTATNSNHLSMKTVNESRQNKATTTRSRTKNRKKLIACQVASPHICNKSQSTATT